MNIFGYSKKRKLSELETKTETLTQDVDGIKTNPTDLSDQTTPYFPQWYMVGEDTANFVTRTDGILEKINADYNPHEFAFTKQGTLNASKFNYKIKYEVLQSNNKFHLFAGVSTKAVWNVRRDGTNYPVSDGWPTSSAVNNLGNSLEIRLTPTFGIINTNYPETKELRADSTTDTRMKDVTGATESDPFILTITIQDGEITSIVADHSTFTAFDYIETDWDPLALPPGPLHMYFIDTSDDAKWGASDWKIRTTILERTVRTDTYTLKNLISEERLPVYNPIVSLSTVDQRFIPEGCKVALLQGFTHATIDDNIYFLPQALYKGQRLVLINQSGVNLTIYNTQPDDPTGTGLGDAWPSRTLAHTGNNDHMEFVAISTYIWHQLI